ncbi:hypothetical protein JE006_23080 [Pseudomonas aeruginosa]|nr:hypothetical protein [Pseudomonas aeruginosa]HEJ1837289.1 hypothetical protein [Pseudomonas aeruginosa]HEK3577542.1 hypothetical protein [Pseudomonas aeruginosa]HEK3590431.1 hypothetical protein [Pseudomonas aeruginosa]
MNNTINIESKIFNQAQVDDYRKNFEPNGKDNVFVNIDNPTLYISALLDYLFTDSIIKYDNEKKEFEVIFKVKNCTHSTTFLEDDLCDAFNMFTTQLFKFCNAKGNKFIADFLRQMCWDD